MKKRIALLSAATLLTLVASLCISRNNALAVVASQTTEPRRLPSNVVPVSYHLSFVPDLKKANFAGEENLIVSVRDGGADEILLNSRDLKINQPIQLTSDIEGTVPVTMTDLPRDAMIQLKPARHLNPGNYKLHLSFSGSLNDKLVGFYKSTFKDSSAHEHVMAVTQFEPTDARRMFPCFDEPEFKASFQLTVTAPPGMVAVTNAPLDHQVKNTDGGHTFFFGSTPRMSSYLVALVVGELEATDPVEVEHVPIRVWSIAGKSKLGLFARDEAAKMLPVLSGYFGIPYAWQKLDLIAIPDFEAGAMENPGAITFRETLLLIDPATASSFAKREASSVIAHEMSHLWFGDLVTMKWWDDLWLNEAFATWSATRAVDKVHPDWQEWKSYASDRVHSMVTDSLLSTRPILFHVTNPEQAHEMFDVITYDKGCSILRMLERYVTEKVFQDGVHQYLAKHSFNNATTEDLWNAIGSAAAAPVADIMHSWVHQPGLPLLTVTGSAQTWWPVTQRRYVEGSDGSSDGSVWTVPVGLRYVGAATSQNQQTPAEERALVSSQQGTLPVIGGSNLPMCVNAGGVGYYRVKYPDDMYQKLADCAETNLDPSERLSILDDTWRLAQSGQIDLSAYLQILSKLKTERDELVAYQIIDQLRYLDRYVDEPRRADFEKFVRTQLHSLYEALGWKSSPDETQQTRMLRASVLSTLGTIGNDKLVIDKARESYATLLASKPGTTGGLDPDLVSPVTEIVAYNGGKNDFEFFKQRYEHAQTPEEEERNLSVLAEFKPADLISRVEDMAINGTVRTQDAPRLLGTLLSRRDTNTQAWNFIESHWQRITAFYPEEMVPHVVSNVSSINVEPDAWRVRQFLSTHRIPSGASTVARTIERMEINVEFRKRSAPQFNEWLKKTFGNA
jgi:puromycin-sensitive aminopeptidase